MSKNPTGIWRDARRSLRTISTASSPLEDPVHPGQLLATIYHSFGINPETIVYNHLNQPRELVKAQAIGGFFA